MAYLRLSGLLTSITGKLNGSYFSQKKGGTTMNRCGSKLTKADSGRVSLQAQQNLLGFTARAWRGLSGDMRTAWQAFAGTLTWRNKAGFEYTPSGYEVYVSCNLNRVAIGEPMIDFPVVSVGDAVLDVLRVDFDLAGDLLLYYPNATTTNNGVQVFATQPQSAGLSYPKGGYKQIYNAGVITSGSVVLSSLYESVFGYKPVVGTMFFKIVITVRDSGVQNGSKLTKADSGFL